MMNRILKSLLAMAIAIGPGGGSLAGTAGRGAEPGGAVPVEVVKRDGHYLLLRGGEPYAIKGAGVDNSNLENLAAHGGNSLRNWGVPDVETGLRLLDQAAELGLTVAMCLCIGRERQGFDYDDHVRVAQQLDWARGQVLAFKDHPALLLWIIGNEPDMEYTNPKVFVAINDLSKMIHEVDGNHPTTTALASAFTPELAALVAALAPDLDIISMQKYADVVNVPRYIKNAGIDQPYLVTEWGPRGHWEVKQTAWGAPVEPDSSEKAAMYREHYEHSVASVKSRVIGDYVFFWDQKQERTPTWYSLFLPDGTETETVDVMHHIWNGSWPENRAPRVEKFRLNGKKPGRNVVLEPGESYPAKLTAVDPDGDPLAYRWALMHESQARQVGGDREEVPGAVPGLVTPTGDGSAMLQAPRQPGAYRLFVYVYDGQGNAGYANIPFLVE
jgi:hypothetical protein